MSFYPRKPRNCLWCDKMYTPTSGIQKFCPECKPLRRRQIKDAEHARAKELRRRNSLTPTADSLDEIDKLITEAESHNR